MRWRNNGRIEAVLLAVVLVLVVAAATVTVAGRFWWLPPLASEHGAGIDRLFVSTLVITGIVFVLVQLALALLVFRYRHREGQKAFHYADNQRLEITWTITIAVILLLLISSGGLLWSRIYGAPPADAYEIEVWGRQFMWIFHYPGKDGVLGRTDVRLISGRNPIGLDMTDPASHDDVVFASVEGDLFLPVNRTIVVRLRSMDVLHSFFIPHFRVKQDAVPGMVTRVWFKPTRKGEFELLCAELCGSGHYTMRASVYVDDEKSFFEWLEQQPKASETLR